MTLEQIKNRVLNEDIIKQFDDKEIKEKLTNFYKEMNLPVPQMTICDSPKGFDKSTLYISISWIVWSAHYEGAILLGAKLDQKKVQLLKDWVVYAPVICGDEKHIFVSRNPVEVNWEDDNLSSKTGMSARWADGYGLWTIDGIPVNRQIVEFPKSQTIEQIDNEENADVRSIRIERYGWIQYLQKTGASIIDERHNDITNQKEVLFRTYKNDTRLVVTCPTKRMFAMGVPETINTCEDAQEWLSSGAFQEIART